MRLFLTKEYFLRNRSGFTLLELLTVVAVVTILFGLIFAAYGTVMDRSKVSASILNLRQLGMAAVTYSSEHNNEYVPHAVFDTELWENKEWCFAYWQPEPANAFAEGILGPYLDEAIRVLTCPVWRTTDQQIREGLRAWGKPPDLGYGYNGLNLSSMVPWQQAPGGQYGHYQGYSRAGTSNPSRTIMFATSAQKFGNSAMPQEMIWGPPQLQECVRIINDRNEAAVAWADGSVSLVNVIPTDSFDGITVGYIDADKDGQSDLDIWQR